MDFSPRGGGGDTCSTLIWFQGNNVRSWEMRGLRDHCLSPRVLIRERTNAGIGYSTSCPECATVAVEVAGVRADAVTGVAIGAGFC